MTQGDPLTSLDATPEGSCPFCARYGDVWVATQKQGHECRYCGQPLIVTPSGQLALTSRVLTLCGTNVARVYTLPGGEFDVQLLDREKARSLAAALQTELARDDNQAVVIH